MNQASTSTALRGTKRKRPEISKEDQLAGKLHHELKAVHQAAKKARTFETQRVVKKLKGLRKKDPKAAPIAAIEAELEELKATEADIFAQTALRTRLLSNRHLSENAELRVAITRELPLVLDTSSGSKVPARLLSSRTLAAAVLQAVEVIRASLLPKTDAATEASASQLADDEQIDADEEEKEGGADDEDEDEDENAEEDGMVSGSVDDVAGDENDRDEEDGWESGSVHSDDAPPAKKPALSKTKIAAATGKASAPLKPNAPGKATTTSSQFLPSLQVGFVRGGSSDSDFEDDEVKADSGRKNRRGQRARQAIWEKKYGRGANHKKKEAEEAAKQAKANAAKSKLSNGKGKARWSESAQVADGGWVGRKAPHAAKPQEQTRTSEPNLHPSWAAKRALKEKLGGGGGIVPSQGKKIVFT